MTNIKAVHWFGREWPVNFWTSDLLRYADEDFRKIVDDGFNSVVLVIPWLGFVDPIYGSVDREYFDNLDSIIAAAKRNGLAVIARVGYPWNLGYKTNKAFVKRLFTEQRVYDAWLMFMSELGRRYTAESSYLFSFISWEDYWPILEFGAEPFSSRLEFAMASGYQKFLSASMPLDEVSRRYGESFQAWNEVPVPLARHPSFYMFFDFFKNLFIEKLFKPAAALAPRMSAEVRVDLDPVYDGDQVHTTYNWSSSWNLKDAEWVTIYFNPYFGAANRKQKVSPEFVNGNFEHLLKRVSDEIGNKKIFIDQFNYRDDTPGMSSDYVVDDELPSFLRLAAGTMSKLADGYAIWFYHGYEHNGISNPDFSRNLDDWNSRGDLRVGDGAVTLLPGAYLERMITRADMQAHVEGDVGRIELTGNSGKGRIELIDVDRDETIASIQLFGSPIEIGVSMSSRLRLRLQAIGAEVTLNHVSVSAHEQVGTIYDKHGRQLFLRDSVRQLNADLWPAGTTKEFLPYADGWVGKYVQGTLKGACSDIKFIEFDLYVPTELSTLVEVRLGVSNVVHPHQLAYGFQTVRVAVQSTEPDIVYTIEAADAQPLPGDGRSLSCILVAVRGAA